MLLLVLRAPGSISSLCESAVVLVRITKGTERADLWTQQGKERRADLWTQQGKERVGAIDRVAMKYKHYNV